MKTISVKVADVTDAEMAAALVEVWNAAHCSAKLELSGSVVSLTLGENIRHTMASAMVMQFIYGFDSAWEFLKTQAAKGGEK